MTQALKIVPKEKDIPVKNDGSLAISIGENRFTKKWHNKTIKWSDFLKRIQKSWETPETHAQFMKESPTKQTVIKDVGGFVGGHLKEGKRSAGFAEDRQIVTLDADFAPADLWGELMDHIDFDFAIAVYSSHKHCEKTPRLRICIPLSKPVTPEQYGAISRKLAEKIGMNYFDSTTFQPERLMFWPSHSSDVTPVFKYYDAPFLDPETVLAEYADWTDVSYWPMHPNEARIPDKEKKKAGDPFEKPGLIGAFNRAYPIKEAIDTFLSEIYTPCDTENRYTYVKGTTAAGLVVYEDEGFAYSHHSTDPAGGQLCNAFDLVRIHLFGEQDEDAGQDTAVTKLPSYKAMQEFARKDDGVKREIAQDKKDQAVLDFGSDDKEENWETKLEVTKNGEIKPVLTNAVLIIQNHPALQGIRFNELSRAVEVRGKLPWKRPANKYWRDADDAQLYGWITDKYGVQFPENKFVKALTIVTDKRSFNPLKEYIQGLPEWDGKPRVDRLLIDYLGAEDVPYVRAVTRKTLIGAIQRVWKPGCKFDTVLVLNGKPGIGKSTLLRKLGGDFFSDNLSLTDTRDKTAAEKLQGVWIMEIGEMQGARKADVNAMKSFISRQVDEYRAAYGRVVERHPRTAILCGTTNSTTGFLRDTTGNRRFWPVTVDGSGPLSVWKLMEETRDQIWAEAAVYAAEGEDSFLDPEMEKEAMKAQQNALEYDERQGEVEEYLDTLLPEDWYSWTKERRVDYFRERDELDPEVDSTIQRTVVCPMEIFLECFRRPANTWRHQDSYEIASIMARISGWEKTGEVRRVPGYGSQRPYTRKVVTPKL